MQINNNTKIQYKIQIEYQAHEGKFSNIIYGQSYYSHRQSILEKFFETIGNFGSKINL